MTSPLRRIAFALVIMALLAGACGSSDEPAAASTVDAATNDAAEEDDTDLEADPTPDDAAEASDPPATTVPDDEPTVEGSETAEEAEAPPPDASEVLVGFARNIFNINPDDPSIECLVADAEKSPETLETMISGAQLDDQGLQQVMLTFNKCLMPIDFGAWATEAVGPTGDVRQTAPDCFATRFDDGDDGDSTLYALTALTLQYRVDPDAVPLLVDAFTACTPVSSIGDFFANQREAELNFEVEIERDCLRTALDVEGVSEAFWGTLISGDAPPMSALTQHLDGCATSINADLAIAVPDDFVPWAGTGALAEIAPAARAYVYDTPPPMTIDPAGSYEAVITTGGGEIRIRLFADTAPVTVNSFVNLVRDGYYERTVFHRVLADFMAQAGDPTGTGSGGPGYQFADEFEDGHPLDRKGLVAMANSGPATNGSQFFLTSAPTEWLTGLHTVFGEVIEGQDIADQIQLRDPANPTGRGQVIDSIVIIES